MTETAARLRAEVDARNRRSDGVREAITKLRREAGSDAGAAPRLRALADAVRDLLASTPSRGEIGAARMGGSAIELAALGDLGRLTAAEQALAALDRDDPQTATIARLHFYAGLDLLEIATVVGMSPTNVRRAWNRARAALRGD
jgi:DNA-directed RNA polymerase specialized sigma24 family protein